MKLRKLTAKPFFIKEILMEDETEDWCASEIQMRKRSITDSKPVHFSTAILQWSKLLFLR